MTDTHHSQWRAEEVCFFAAAHTCVHQSISASHCWAFRSRHSAISIKPLSPKSRLLLPDLEHSWSLKAINLSRTAAGAQAGECNKSSHIPPPLVQKRGAESVNTAHAHLCVVHAVTHTEHIVWLAIRYVVVKKLSARWEMFAWYLHSLCNFSWEYCGTREHMLSNMVIQAKMMPSYGH